MHFLIICSALVAQLVVVLSAPTLSTFSILQERVRATIPSNGREALRRAYAKYGIPLPDPIERRYQRGSAEALPFPNGDTYPDDEYIERICIGSPGQDLKVNLDTGSSDLWVFSSETPAEARSGHSYYDPSKSTSSKKLDGYSYSISYGDGQSSSGNVYIDTVNVGGVSFPTQAVEVATDLSPTFTQDIHFDGFLGMGLPSGNKVEPVPQATFLSNIVPTLIQPLFTASLNHLSPGSYDFGFIDPRKYTGGLKFFPTVPPPPGQYWWIVEATGISVGSNKTVLPFKPGASKAIIDTGSKFLLLQEEYVDAYFAQAPFVENDPIYGLFYPCNKTLPDLTIVIGDYKGVIPGSMLQGANVDESNCATALNPIPAGSGFPEAVLGATFLKSTFTVFSQPAGKPPTLGFGTKNIQSSIAPPPS